MYKRIYFIALVRHTLYLFNKEEKIVLPIEVKNMEALMFLTGRAHANNNFPHFYVFVKNLLKFFGAKLISVTVFSCDGGLYCANLNLVLGDRHLKLPLGFIDAFVLSRLFDAPLYIEADVLAGCGIRVSKEILRDALKE